LLWGEPGGGKGVVGVSRNGPGGNFGVGGETIGIEIWVKKELASCCGVNLAGGKGVLRFFWFVAEFFRKL
jgi:hypothetical protein